MIRDSQEVFCVIHRQPVYQEDRHVDEDDGTRLESCAGGFSQQPAPTGRQGPQRPAVSGSAALFLGSQYHLAGFAQTIWQLEQRLETILALKPVRRFRSVFRDIGFLERNGGFGANVRFHRGSRTRFSRRGKRGQENQALGRSRGGFSTKIHLKTDFDGHYLAFDLTGGEKGDAPHLPVLLDLGADNTPRAAIGDKGYDSKANRNAARERNIIPVIPYKSNAKIKPKFFPKNLYKTRARIEQAVGKLKRFKRIALRCEKTKVNFLSFVHIAAGFILCKSVHMA